MPSSIVHNEDCFCTLQRIQSSTVNLLLQDTPFGVTQNAWDVKPNLQKMWPEWKRVATPNAAFIFFATQPFASELIMSNLDMFRYDLIWYKALGTGFLNANRMPLRNHEHILIFYSKPPTFNPQKYIGRMRQKGGSADRTGSNYGTTGDNRNTNNVYYPQSVMDFSNRDKTKESDHPTQKPLALIRTLIRTYSNPGDLVFDGYLGSGTTRVAAYLEGRDFIGAELDSTLGYFQAQEKRFALAIQQTSLF